MLISLSPSVAWFAYGAPPAGLLVVEGDHRSETAIITSADLLFFARHRRTAPPTGRSIVCVQMEHADLPIPHIKRRILVCPQR